MQMMNPFLRSVPDQTPKPRDPQLNMVARKLVFGTANLTSDEVSQVFKRTHLMTHAESPDQDLATAQEAFLGIAAHEAAEQAFEAFNAELTKFREPENLTRTEVKKLFEQSRYGKMLQKHERVAIEHFSNVLEKDGDFSVATSENTGFDAIDIKTYLLDLQNRVAERLEDPEERKETLEKLDAELAALIKSVPEESWGKKLELQEIYLLRRLIHRADTGHLAHVSHGTLRQDLRADMGSVDMRLAVAGDLFDFQLKTFKSGVSDEAKAKQYDVIARSKRRAEESGTHFVMLETDRVQAAYDRSQRQKTTENQTVGDKFAALQPLTNDLTIRERARTLQLFGLNEETLAKEQAAFDEQQQRMTAHLDEVRAKAAAEKARFDEVAALRAKQLAEEEAARIKKQEAIEGHEEWQRLEAMKRRQIEAEEKELNRLARASKKSQEKELLDRLERERAAEIAAAKAAEEKKAKAKETKAQSEAKVKWIKAKSAELMNIPALVKAGFLAAENKMVPAEIKAAKEMAEKLYTKKYILEHFPFEDSSEQ